MNALAAIASAAGAVLAALVATTFKLLPDEVTPVSFVLQIAGVAAIVGTVIGILERRSRPPDRKGAPLRPYAEYGTVMGLLAGLVLFLLLYVIQELS